ncbi:hypothetical protein PV10_04781 [Exophiala mesophila]|uniref:Uncharacterized protein n=1 Tax=Exophiala mesophila TaxID=212818 RepID=A0A0D1ZFW5_EXOME|nr:uncharacterized protein PV10_04781 [Exophiala mesophila]KIV93577.1 hypothetical protein PV10_04781 [Exophiala mesophila]
MNTPGEGEHDISGLNESQTSGSHPTPDSQGIPLRVKENTDMPPNEQVNAGDEYDPGPENDYGIISSHPPELEKKKKRKKHKKPASKRGLGAPTGFEDFFADPPLTPEQYAQNKELFNPVLPFFDRIMTAIERFQRTRKMTPERNEIFRKYLTYGGVNTGPTDFQKKQDTNGMDKSTMVQISINAALAEEKRNLNSETSVWVVDFLGCMKGFLSRHGPDVVRHGFESRTDVELVTSTLERFMDYLLQHDVCVEYQADVLATRNFCREAVSELWDVAQAIRKLPGDFNTACSTLFGGSHANDDGEAWWGPDEAAAKEAGYVGMKPDEARQILHFGVSGAADEEVFAHYLAAVNGSKSLEVVSVTAHTGFEITRIEYPSAECKAIYTTHSTHFRPVGRVFAKPWADPEAPPEDLTAAEREELENRPIDPDVSDNEQEYLFFVESILQGYLRIGTKIQATVHTLNCGIMFFDACLAIFPSFDVYLPNELMAGWKAPRPLEGAFDYESPVEVDPTAGDDHGRGDGDGDGEEDYVNVVAGADDDDGDAAFDEK